MALRAGQSLTHYEILGPLGVGAMGEVYRALDTRLERQVAIKVLPEHFAEDEERLRRFEREAKSLASLNHSNVAQVFGIDQVEDTCFMAMELVPGETLEDRITRGPLPMEEAIDVCRQIAEGLEAAHEAGVIHRDLKPANVRITPDGKVKVLDFGLAKPTGPNADSESTTDSVLSTEAGRLLGTPTYMAPEQARGKPIDRRVDVWAFGCVLFECLTATRAFAGETLSDVLAAVLNTEPDQAALPHTTPSAVRDLIGRCLEKDARQRLRDVGEARVRLEQAFESPTERDSSTPQRRPALLPWVAAVAVVTAGVFGWTLKPERAPTETAPLRKLEFTSAVEPLQEAVLSPDGRRVALIADNRLWVRDLAELEARELPDTEHARFVFWSPDGSQVGYLQDRRLWRSESDGRGRQRIVDLEEMWVNGAGAHWTDDDRIVFARGNRHLQEVAVTGGEVRLLLESPDVEFEHFHDPCVLPGARGTVFATHGPGGVDTLELFAAGERHVLLHVPGENLDNPCYSPTGHLIFSRGPDPAGIWALPFDLERLEVTGQPFVVTSGGTHPSLATDGSLLYRGGRSSLRRGLVWASREGEVLAEIGEPQRDPRTPRLSPDGRWIVVSAAETGARKLWLHDVEHGTRRQLTFGSERDVDPSWLDERHVIFTRNLADGPIAYRVAVDGSSEPEPLSGARGGEATKDGRYRVFHEKGEVWLVEDEGEPVVFHPYKDVDVRWPVLSPRGDYVVFGSDTTGLGTIMLARFPSGDGRWQIHTGAANWLRWSPAGDELIFTGEGNLYAMNLRLGDEVSFDPPRTLFGETNRGLICGLGYDLDLAGERILCLRSETVERTTVTLVQSWYSEFASEDARR